MRKRVAASAFQAPHYGASQSDRGVLDFIFAFPSKFGGTPESVCSYSELVRNIY
jgi:hypothetical protein